MLFSNGEGEGIVVVMIVFWFTTTCAIIAYHYWSFEFKLRSCRGVFDTALCDKVCQWLTAGQWFFHGTPVSSTNKTNLHVISEILLKVALNTMTLILTRYTKQFYIDFIPVYHYTTQSYSNIKHLWYILKHICMDMS